MGSVEITGSAAFADAWASDRIDRAFCPAGELSSGKVPDSPAFGSAGLLAGVGVGETVSSFVGVKGTPELGLEEGRVLSS